MTDAELDQCRHDGALLRSIVADQVKLKREGREWKGLCPFHDETTPSFTVYEDGHFHCFGCGAHGTSFDYVMKRDGVEFPEAAKRVAAEIGATPSRAKPERRPTATARTRGRSGSRSSRPRLMRRFPLRTSFAATRCTSIATPTIACSATCAGSRRRTARASCSCR